MNTRKMIAAVAGITGIFAVYAGEDVYQFTGDPQFDNVTADRISKE